jgi:hypothetical protein
VFQNRVLRRIYGPKKNAVTGDWRKLHNEELHSLYSSSSIMGMKSWWMRLSGHVARMGKNRNTYRILVRKPEVKRSLGRQKCWLIDNINKNFREIGWRGMVWIDLVQDRGPWRPPVNTRNN